MRELVFRQVVHGEVTRVCEIIDQAKAQMRALGSIQWQTGYPAKEDINRDLARGAGWVLCGDYGIVAYGAVIFDGEPAYDQLVGRWLTDGPFVVVHRLAVADEAKRQGVARQFMQKAQTLARQRGVGSLRVDTNFDNSYMLRLLAELGFSYCGKIYYDSGERLAFEKLL